MRDPQGRSRGFAFLTFENPASVNAVMVREHTVDNKIVSAPPQSPYAINRDSDRFLHCRSTRSERSLERSTPSPKKSSLADSLPASTTTHSNSSLCNLVTSWMRMS
jgi:RNA recognition motif-containing protein